MKKSLLLFILFSQFVFNFILKNEISAQTATTTINYTGFQACGGCTVCGADYWCFNTVSSYCGNTVPCGTTTFVDPCPAGSIVTSVTVNFFSADCAGGAMTATIDGNPVPTVNEGNTGCLCSSSPCAQSATSSANYPCGLPGYVNGGVNSLQMCTGASVCINRVELVFTYAPASQATPATLPATPSGPTPVCAGTTYTYSVPAVNASTYTWTVPAGWIINSGQGTTSITATPGSAGNICVTASNLCGSSSPSCLAVSIASPSVAPTSANATPNPICPSIPTTLSVGGGSLGVGASWNWYTGSCGGTLIGTGSSLVVSPASSTTYFVGAVGTCNVTACASVLVSVSGITPLPATPSGSSSVCDGSTQTYSTTGSAGATSYTWSVPAGAVINSGSGTTSISVTFGSSSGNICVTATGPCGTSSPSCTPITISSTPVATYSYTGTPYCQDAANPSPTFSGGGSAGNFTASPAGLSIDPITGIVNLAASTAGTYTVTNTIAATGGCPAVVATSNITITALPVATFTYTGTPYCQNAANPSPAYSGGGVAGSFTASPAGLSIDPVTGIVDLAASAAGTYTITNTIAAVSPCSAVFATSSFTINSVPTMTNANTANVCSGTALNITLTGSVASTYSWIAADNTNTTGESITSQTAGTINDIITATSGSTETVVYSVTLLSTFGCSSASPQTITVTVNPAPTMTNTTAVTICSGTALNINLTGSIASTYTWIATDNTNTTGESIISQTTATINDIITNTTSSSQTVVYNVALLSTAAGCLNTTPQTITVTVNPSPSADSSSIIITPADCNLNTGSVLGIIVVSGIGPFTYLWQNTLGDTVGTNLDLTNVSPGNYFLTVTDSNNCSIQLGNGIGIIIPSSTPIAAFTANPTTGETPLAVNFTNGSTGATSYLWQFGTGDTSSVINPSYTYTPLGNFIVCLMASSVAGCVDTVCSTIDVYVNSVFIIPNVFTPNNDNINDVFTVQSVGLETMDAEIYSRWGQKEFEWHTTNGGWDGHTASGVESPDGTYFYIIKAKGYDDKEYFEKGYFTLIR